MSARRPAVAVLPFENLSSDPEQAYFADGLAEDLITRLVSWRAFPVIARNSSFQFRGAQRRQTHAVRPFLPSPPSNTLFQLPLHLSE